MKNTTILFVILILNSISLFSQTSAVTDKGEEVILYDNGTWKYKKENAASWGTRIDTVVFKKNVDSNFLLKGAKVNYGVWLNPKVWKFKKNEDDDSPSEYNFTLVDEDAYAMIIVEKIEIPLNTLKDLAYKNALKASPDVRIVYEDIRKVNGLIVNCMEMEGTISGIKFSYFSYYYTGPSGTIQFVSYTSQNLYKKYKPELEKLLNGFVVIK